MKREATVQISKEKQTPKPDGGRALFWLAGIFGIQIVGNGLVSVLGFWIETIIKQSKIGTMEEAFRILNEKADFLQWFFLDIGVEEIAVCVQFLRFAVLAVMVLIGVLRNGKYRREVEEDLFPQHIVLRWLLYIVIAFTLLLPTMLVIAQILSDPTQIAIILSNFLYLSMNLLLYYYFGLFWLRKLSVGRVAKLLIPTGMFLVGETMIGLFQFMFEKGLSLFGNDFVVPRFVLSKAETDIPTFLILCGILIVATIIGGLVFQSTENVLLSILPTSLLANFMIFYLPWLLFYGVKRLNRLGGIVAFVLILCAMVGSAFVLLFFLISAIVKLARKQPQE
ncbi:MAG: hypothetical protein IJY42_06410 [Clostridia bacterium]|nr:hypothetical protein [Clostridia bacterium]